MTTYYRIVQEFRAKDDAEAVNKFKSAIAKSPRGIDQVRLDKVDPEHGNIWINFREEILHTDA